MAQDVVAE